MTAVTIDMPTPSPDRVKPVPLRLEAARPIIAPALCLFWKGPDGRGPDGWTPSFRSTPGRLIYEACLVDARGRMLDLADLIIHAPERSEPEAPADATDPEAMVIWRSYVDALVRLTGERAVFTGWEETTPRPVWIDAARGELVTTPGWQLCTDDDLLEHNDLPRRSKSGHRYLHRVESDGGSHCFAPLHPDAPRPAAGSRFQELEQLVPGLDTLLPINPGCSGMVLVRKPRSSWTLSDHARFLSGESPAESPAWLRVRPQNSPDPGLTLCARMGIRERAIETLHLKLAIMLDAASAAREESLKSGMPLLNIQPSHFRVRLAEPGGGLPLLWSARVELAEPGVAVKVNASDGRLRGYRQASGDETIVRAPQASPGWAEARHLSVTDLRPVAGGQDSWEISGTFRSTSIDPSPQDIVVLHAALPGEPLRLTGQSHREANRGPWKFRSDPFPARPALIQRWQRRDVSGLTIPIQRVEHFPLKTPLLDRERMGYLAACVLLEHDDNSPARIADALRNLSDLLDQRHPQAIAPIEVLQAMRKDRELERVLGSGNLLAPRTDEPLVTDWLWAACLTLPVAAIRPEPPADVRALPPAPGEVFDDLIMGIGALMLRTRTLLAPDQNRNMIVRRAIDEVRRHGG